MKRKFCDVCESSQVMDTDTTFIFHTAPLRSLIYLEHLFKDKISWGDDNFSLCREHYIEALELLLAEAKAGAV